jgi:acyl-CoA thioester hydrolase
MTKRFDTYRGFVYPWSLDHQDHLNVQSYVARFDEASWQLLAMLGLTPKFLASQDHGVVALDQRIEYRREVLSGGLLHVVSELTEVNTKTLRFVHRMFDSDSREVVACMTLRVGYFDKTMRHTAALPDPIAARAREALIAPAAGPAP